MSSEHDDGATLEIAREAGRVLPLVGCPRWALWLGTLLAVVLYVVGRRLLPHLGAAIWDALKNVKVEPQIVADENGPQPDGVPLNTDPDSPGGGSFGG